MEHFITSIHINEVRHLKNIEIKLNSEKRQHLILTGKNGSGKTSVLRAMKSYLQAINDRKLDSLKGEYLSWYNSDAKKLENATTETEKYKALEELKNDVSFQQFIRIVESLQAAVEKIPIKEAFDELDTERAYHQEKRKESNERMISKKSMIGKAIGFAPMVCLFVVYLIIPLCVIGMTSMTEAFNEMSSQL